MRLLYFVPSARGGIADYAHEQATALAALGVAVTALCTPAFAEAHPGAAYAVAPRLLPSARAGAAGSRVRQRAHFARSLLRNAAALARETRRGGYEHVLLDSYVEYLAPLWCRPLLRLARDGVVFGATVHDPVRNYVVGPARWHRWSVACGYTFLREAFVHEAVPLDTVRPMPALRTTVVPHGPYCSPPPRRTRSATRAALGVPDGAPLMLAFGSIRDDKQLDLVIRAMPACPKWYLLVAGQTISAASRPVAFYQQLAESLGVAERCRWQVGFVPSAEVGDLFSASDVALLTYAPSFRSQSGVLSTAVAQRTPCLASGGAGAMRSAVLGYGLGCWIESGSVDAVVDALRRWPAAFPTPEWERYERDHSWESNARRVWNALADDGVRTDVLSSSTEWNARG